MKQADVVVGGKYRAKILKAGTPYRQREEVVVTVVAGGRGWSTDWQWACVYPAPFAVEGAGLVLLTSRMLIEPVPEEETCHAIAHVSVGDTRLRLACSNLARHHDRGEPHQWKIVEQRG